MRIQFEIKESLINILDQLMHSDFWATEIKEDESGKKIIKIKDLAYNLEAVAEVMGNEIFIRTALSKYTYRIYEVKGECWCEYVGAYRGFLEQKLLPIITPKENLLECEVLDSSILGGKQKTLREYAEDNLKLKKFREQNFGNNGFSKADHPRRVYDEFIKEDFILYYFHALIIVILKTRINTGNVCRQVGHFCGTWCLGEWND